MAAIRQAVCKDGETPLPLAAIYEIDGMQFRNKLSEERIATLQLAYEDGEHVEAIAVVSRRDATDPSKEYGIISGHHRYYAALEAGLISINAKIQPDVGDDQLAELAWQSNTRHGLPYTRAEKHVQVEYYLQDGLGRSNRAIARLTDCDEKTVRTIKVALECGDSATERPGPSLATLLGLVYKKSLEASRYELTGDDVRTALDQFDRALQADEDYMEAAAGAAAVLRACAKALSP